MTFQIVTEPIPEWPLPNTKPRRNAQFSAGYADTLNLLRTELGHLDARGAVVMQVVTKNGQTDLRRDGALRAQAQITHPGVRISFESKHGPLTYSTDVFEPAYYRQMDGWKANLRAIALGLEALRKVDRYGIGRSGEQYKGWLAIDGAGPDLAAARNVLLQYGHGRIMPDPSADLDYANAFRLARISTHPDRNEGDRSEWDAVEAAGKLLGLLT